MAQFFCAAIVCLLGMEIPTALGPAFSGGEASQNAPSRTLTFAERVAYQYAIEEIYWRHRTWPTDNPEPKPPVGAVLSREQIEKKVTDYLRKSQLVTNQRGSPISARELQAEMDRMASHTKRPEVLRELFAALGNDPFVIGECLARPILAERLADGPGVVPGVSPAPTSSSPADTVASTMNRTQVTTNVNNAQYKLPQISVPTDCTDDTWTATSITNAPIGRIRHTAVWTGSEMIVWGGTTDQTFGLGTGGRYDPSTDSWTATSTSNAPSFRFDHTAVWTGGEMIIWGGVTYPGPVFLRTGARYNPSTDTWTATSTINAPTGRFDHTAVWTGSEMIAWGGLDTISYANTGGRYNPTTDTWVATSISNAPTGRLYHTAVWTGSDMIVWGGDDGSTYLNTGGRYDPSNDSWTATSTTGALHGRELHTTVWTGSKMIVWGGYGGRYLSTGARYDPSTDTWTATSTTNAPTGRLDHTAVWTGNEMIVWGGDSFEGDYDTGGRYDAATDSWTATSTSGAPAARYWQTAVWTDSQMIVWGGANYTNNYDTGGRYCAESGSRTITLSGSGRKVGGINMVRLTWSGATSSNLDVYRDRALIVTTANDGSYVDSTGDTGRGRYTYEVCEAGNSTCSNNARVTFQQ